jgi:hypothetical protein
MLFGEEMFLKIDGFENQQKKFLVRVEELNLKEDLSPMKLLALLTMMLCVHLDFERAELFRI